MLYLYPLQVQTLLFSGLLWYAIQFFLMWPWRKTNFIEKKAKEKVCKTSAFRCHLCDGFKIWKVSLQCFLLYQVIFEALLSLCSVFFCLNAAFLYASKKADWRTRRSYFDGRWSTAFPSEGSKNSYQTIQVKSASCCVFFYIYIRPKLSFL